MGRNDIQPTGGPIWPLAPQSANLPAIHTGQRAYAGTPVMDLNLATLWRIVSEWRWLILATTAAALAGALIITFLTEPKYRAGAVLEINPPTVQILADEDGGQPMVQNDREFLATQYGLLASRSLAERVAQELNLASNQELVGDEGDRAARQKVAVGTLMSGFEVEPVPASRLINISFSATDPQLAARVTNAFADNFINSNLERRYEANSYARNFLQRQIAKVKADLEASEKKLVQYAQAQGIIDTSSAEGGGADSGSLESASLVALNEALAQATRKRVEAQTKMRNAAGMSAAQVSQSTSQYRSQIAGLEAEYQEKLSRFKPDYPDMVRLRERIESLREAQQSEARAVGGGSSTTLAAEYRAAAAEENALRARVGQLKGAVLDLRGRSIEHNILQREVDTNRTMYDALLQRYKEIGVAGGVGTNSVMVVDRAEPPGSPYEPNLMMNLLIGLIAGLGAGILAAIAFEYLNDTIKWPDDVRDKLGLPSLGAIPKRQGEGSMREELEDPSSAISEAYHSLRTSLQFTGEDGVPKPLLLTSARKAEGKSSSTLALAQIFARLGNRVLLVDSDLRKPAFVTGAAPKRGLSMLLSNHDPLQGHVVQTRIPNLWLLPCGPLPPNPAELLASPRLRALLKEAADAWDVVIVDGPPVLGLADAPLLSAACAGTLLVVESGKTRTRAAIDAVNRLRSSGGNVLGATLTKMRARGSGYGYGYDYEPYRYGGGASEDRKIELLEQSDA